MRALRLSRLIVLPALLALAACGSSSREDVLPTPVVDPAFSATTLETPGVPVNNVGLDAGLRPPAERAGGVLAVRERRYVNGASQQIVLDGERVKGIENRIDISVQTQGEGSRQDLYVPMQPPNEIGIGGEIADRFPNMAMQVSQKPVANSYGPYGLAIGRDGATRCIYAWQWIDDLTSNRPRQLSLLQRLSLVSGAAPAPASNRVRVCRRDVTLDQLAGYMTQMVIGTVQTLNRLLAQGGTSGYRLGRPARRLPDALGSGAAYLARSGTRRPFAGGRPAADRSPPRRLKRARRRRRAPARAKRPTRNARAAAR